MKRAKPHAEQKVALVAGVVVINIMVLFISANADIPILQNIMKND